MKPLGIVVITCLALVGGCNSKQAPEPRAPLHGETATPPAQTNLDELTPEQEQGIKALMKALKPDLDPATPFADLAPQFAVFDLPEFRQSTISMVRGPGGRWVSARFVSTSEVQRLTRWEVTNRVARAYVNAGWTTSRKPVHKQKYVLSEIWETSTNDLWFIGPRGYGSMSNASYDCAIHVSTNADVVCVYTEIGW